MCGTHSSLPIEKETAMEESLHVAGVYSTYENAVEAWRSNAQRTVDDAEMKYVIVHLHKLLDPGA